MTDQKVHPDGSYPGSQPPPPPAYTAGPQGTAAPGYGPPPVIVGVPAGPQPGATLRYRSDPALIICQHCNSTVSTSVTYQTGTFTWVSAGLLCLFGLWLGCCLIPFCINATKDGVHTCPNCKQIVGTHKQMS